jgi:methyl-accepting chemotaxis protein
MQWSVSRKIVAGYVLALFVIVVIGAITYRSTLNFTKIVRIRGQSHVAIVHLEALLSDLKDAETGERGFVITGQDEYLEPSRDGEQSVFQHLEKIRTLPAIDARDKDALDELEKSIQKQLKLTHEVIEARKDPAQGREKAEAKITAGAGKKGMDDIRKVVGDLQKQEQERFDKRSQEADDDAIFIEATILGGTLVAFVLLGLSGAFISRSIGRPLNAAINVLTTSASQIATATVEVAANATETATAVTQTTATVAEVKQTALTAVQKAKHVADAAQQTAHASESGTRAVEDMLTGIQRIREQTDSVAASIVRLSEQSQAIGAILSTVDDLAAQSNLLAVNAAIEAAKAGEQGKGFAVVAQEVKSLAEQSKQATAQVRTILSDIQKATSSAVLATEQSSKAVNAGLQQAAEAGHSVRTLSDSITQSAQAAVQIAASCQQQLVGMDQLAQAMESIKQASVQNANSTRQTETAARNLTELGQQLKRVVSGSES